MQYFVEVSLTLENTQNSLYQRFSDLHFAVWNMIKPVNYIWVDFDDRCVRCGVKNEPTDAIADERAAAELAKDAFIELISYDEDGSPILGFDDEAVKKDYAEYPASDEDIAAFLGDMESIDLLGWRNQFPSLREGLCWRIDVYYEGGEKHISGQARFPQEWTAFGKSLNALVKRSQDAAETK